MKKNINIAAVIPAAGVGSRMQLDFPKQYLKINDKTLLEHTVNKICAIKEISTIILAISPDDQYFETLDFKTNINTVHGGKERVNSVLNALRALDDQAPEWVLVHDAARPLVTATDIRRLINECINNNQGGILACRVKDTIKQGHTHSLKTVPRADLWQALTPQLFPFIELKNALKQALHRGWEVTDEASAMEQYGQPVQLIPGRSDNLKITSPEDYALACFLISQQQESE